MCTMTIHRKGRQQMKRLTILLIFSDRKLNESFISLIWSFKKMYKAEGMWCRQFSRYDCCLQHTMIELDFAYSIQKNERKMYSPTEDLSLHRNSGIKSIFFNQHDWIVAWLSRSLFFLYVEYMQRGFRLHSHSLHMWKLPFCFCVGRKQQNVRE